MRCPEVETMLQKELQMRQPQDWIIYRQLAAKAKTESVKMKSITRSMKRGKRNPSEERFLQPCHFAEQPCHAGMPGFCGKHVRNVFENVQPRLITSITTQYGRNWVRHAEVK
jgi:hypothetical protein